MKVAVVCNRDRSGVINVFGWQNTELYDPRTLEAVAAALEARGHNVRVIEGNMHVIEQLREFMPGVVRRERPGLVFNMAYGIQGVSRYTHLPAMLEMLGVPYVGSGPQAHALALDKVIAKILFDSHGISTPRFWNFASADDSFDDLVFPVIVKPKMEAASSGIKIVHNETDLRDAVRDLIERFNQHVLVEQFVEGREFTVGLLGNRNVEVLPVLELDLAGDPTRIRDDEKNSPLNKICPAPLPPHKVAELETMARRAFQVVGLYDFARIDVRMDRDGNVYLLEINSMADLGPEGAYVHAAKTAGYTYETLINRVLDVAAVRYFGDQAPDSASSARVAVSEPGRESIAARVRSYLRSQATTHEDLLRNLVDTHTTVGNFDRVTSQLQRLGFNRSGAQLDEDDTLYFTNHGNAENDVMLVLPWDDAEAESAFISFRAEENRLYGSGVLRPPAAQNRLRAAAVPPRSGPQRRAEADREPRGTFEMRAGRGAHRSRGRPGRLALRRGGVSGQTGLPPGQATTRFGGYGERAVPAADCRGQAGRRPDRRGGSEASRGDHAFERSRAGRPAAHAGRGGDPRLLPGAGRRAAGRSGAARVDGPIDGAGTALPSRGRNRRPADARERAGQGAVPRRRGRRRGDQRQHFARATVAVVRAGSGARRHGDPRRTGAAG